MSAGGFTALVVALGRLWTKSYYDTFGLPTSDLQLTTEDYAFRAKEALIMVTIAAVGAFAVWWLLHSQESTGGQASTSAAPAAAEDPPHANTAMNRSGASPPSHGETEAPTPANSGGGDRTSRTRWPAVAARAAIGLVIVLLLLFVVTQLQVWLVEAPPSAIAWPGQQVESHWNLTANVIGFLVGIAGGLLTIAVMKATGPPTGRLVAFLVAIGLIVIYLPFAVVRLAHASALQAMETRRLTHAVIEFTGEAPAAIRSGDDPSRSVRVYVVLLTPDRLAVAFPYPCTHVTTARRGDVPLDAIDLSAASAGSTVCDTLVFNRDQVKSIRILGKGGRPSNDEPAQADQVELAANPVNGEVHTQTVFQQAFDFAEARSLRVTCAPVKDGGDKPPRQGVWLRLTPRDPGWVSVEGGPGHMLRTPVADPGSCLPDSNAPFPDFQVEPGKDQLLYLYAGPKEHPDVRTVTVRYTPVTTLIQLTEESLLHVAVEVESSTDRCNLIERDLQESLRRTPLRRPILRSGLVRPTVAAPGVGPTPANCAYDNDAARATYNFEPQAPAPPGTWQVTICTGHENVTALRAMATPVERPAGPTPQDGTPGDDNAAHPAEDGVAQDQGAAGGRADEGTSAPLAVPCPHDD